MSYSFLIKEDGDDLLKEDGVSKFIFTEDLITQKVNLEVKRSFADAYEIQYSFRLTSNEPTEVIDLTNYRIVQYLNIRWKNGLNYTLGQNGLPFGGATGLASFNAPTDKIFNTVDDPPHIFPETDRFMLKRMTRFASGTLNGIGQGYEGMYISTTKGVYPFFKNDDNLRDYEPQHCRTATDSTSYVDNPTFVLEYNNTSSKTNPYAPEWTLVTEYTTSATVDPNTGVYPLSAYGDNTKIFNRLTYPNKDNLIKQFLPGSTENSLEIYQIIKGSGYAGRILEYYPLHETYSDLTFTSSTTLINLRAAEFNKFTSFEMDESVIEVLTLSSDFDTDTATWISDVDNVDTLLGDAIPGPIPTDQVLSYFRWEVDNLVPIKNWMFPSTSSENHGVVTKHYDESGPIYTDFKFASTNISDPLELPFLVTNITQARGENIWTGLIDDEWSNPGNWQGLQIPDETSGAIFDGSVSNNPCILDSNQKIYNIVTKNSAGSLDLSSYNLTIVGNPVYLDELSNLSQSDDGTITFENTICNISFASSLDNAYLGNIFVDQNAFVSIYGDVVPRFTSSFNIDGTIMLLSDVVLSGGDTNFGPTSVIDSPRDVDNNNYFLVLDGASLDDTGTLSAGIIYQKFDNEVTARVYGGRVIFTNAELASGLTATMVMASGTHIYQDGIKIESIDDLDATLVIDCSSFDPSITIDKRRGIDSNTNAGFSSDKTDGDEIIIHMGSKNWKIKAGTFELLNIDVFNNDLGGGFELSDSIQNLVPPSATGIIMPPIYLYETDDRLPLSGDLHCESFKMYENAKFNFNHFNISAVNDIIVSNGDSQSFINISGSQISGKNISFIGKRLDLIDLTSEQFWFVSASENLNARYAKLKSSDASGGVTGIARNSQDLGGV